MTFVSWLPVVLPNVSRPPQVKIFIIGILTLRKQVVQVSAISLLPWHFRARFLLRDRVTDFVADSRSRGRLPRRVR